MMMTQAQTSHAQPEPAAKPPKTGMLEELIRKNPNAVIPSNVILADYQSSYTHVRGLTSALSRGQYSDQDVQENMAKAMIGAERGIPMVTAIECLHLVEGRIMAGVWLLQAMAEEEGWRFDWSSDDPCNDCTVTATHKEHGQRSFKFTIEMAYIMKGRKPGSGFATSSGKKSNWDKTPWAMLYARAASIVARRCCPRRLLGMYETDEIDDIRTMPEDIPRVGRHSFDAASMRGPEPPAETAENIQGPPPTPTAPMPPYEAYSIDHEALADPERTWEEQVSFVANVTDTEMHEATDLLTRRLEDLPRAPDDPKLRADLLRGVDWRAYAAETAEPEPDEDTTDEALFDG